MIGSTTGPRKITLLENEIATSDSNVLVCFSIPTIIDGMYVKTRDSVNALTTQVATLRFLCEGVLTFTLV